MTNGRSGFRVRAVVALVIGLVAPYAEVAWKCRPGYETGEACVWGKATFLLAQVLGLAVVAPLSFLVLTAVGARLNSRRR